MPIYRVERHRIDLGPFKFFPVAGPEVPIETNGLRTRITLTQETALIGGEKYGVLAELTGEGKVALYDYWDGEVKKKPFATLTGKQISRHHLTRDRLRWVARTTPSFVTEVSQLPGSTL